MENTDQRGRFDDQSELIFNTYAGTFKSELTPDEAANDQVDLEIILLGPKARKSKHDRRITESIDPTNSNKDVDLSEFDPYHREKESAIIDNREVESTSGSKQTYLSPPSQVSERDGKSVSTSKSTKRISSPLLEQMERQFKDDNLRADDDSQIDYLDYF